MDQITSRMQRTELLGLLHAIEPDRITARISIPALEPLLEVSRLGDGTVVEAEGDRETAIIPSPIRGPRRHLAWAMALGFVVAFVAGFALTVAIAPVLH